MGKIKSTSTVRTIVVASTVGGVKLPLPEKTRMLTVIPDDLTKMLSIKFKLADAYLVVPAGNGYSTGYSDSVVSNDVYVLMSDGSGVKAEYWE